MCSIISRPYAVVDDEISRQGILPMTAPVKPYTLFALTCVWQGLQSLFWR